MPVQEPRKESPRERQNHENAEVTGASSATSLDALDDLLSEIDATLEQNAAAFVAAFVQKGGQ